MSNARKAGSGNGHCGNNNRGGGYHQKNMNRHIGLVSPKNRNSPSPSPSPQPSYGSDIESQLANLQNYLLLDKLRVAAEQEQLKQQEYKKQQIMAELQFEICKGEREILLKKVETLAHESEECMNLYKDYLASREKSTNERILSNLDIMKGRSVPQF